jgi:hypothetical protein
MLPITETPLPIASKAYPCVVVVVVVVKGGRVVGEKQYRHILSTNHHCPLIIIYLGCWDASVVP